MLIGAILGGALALVLHFFGVQDTIINLLNIDSLGIYADILYYIGFVALGGLIGYLIDR